MDKKILTIGIVIIALLIGLPIYTYNIGYDKAEKEFNNNRYEGEKMYSAATFRVAICKGGSEFFITTVGDVQRQLQNPAIETCMGGRTFLYSEELVPYVIANNQSRWATP